MKNVSAYETVEVHSSMKLSHEYASLISPNSRVKTKHKGVFLSRNRLFCLYRCLKWEWKSDVSHVRFSHCCWTETWSDSLFR